jgi:DNA-binding FadR family transcriptional regulator
MLHGESQAMEESEDMLTAAVAPAEDREARPQPVWMSGCALVLAGDPRDTQHALTVRTALEPELLQQAAHDRRGLDAAELDVFLEAMAECRNDAVAFVRAHWALHRRLAELTANPVLRDVYLAMLDIAEDRLEGAVAGPAFLPRSLATVQRHRELVAAIAAGDTELARDLAGRDDAGC